MGTNKQNKILMNRFVLSTLAAVLVSAAESFNDEQYLALSRSEKMDQIKNAIVEDSTPQDWYSTFKLAGLFTESMQPTMHAVGDELPKQGHGTRLKLIHTQGAIASVKFETNGNHPFTGLWSTADSGIIRMSSAAQPVNGSQPLAPGIALKFLRDGMESASLVAMYSVDGQESWDFFANDFTNHIGPAGLSLQPLAAKFATATDYVQAVGLSDWAQHS